MEYLDPKPRVHRWISWTNAIFVVLHLLVVFFVLFSPLIISTAPPTIITNGLLALHGVLAGILAMHQISINLSFDPHIDYEIPEVLLVAPSNLIVTINVICFVFNVLHVVSVVSVAIGVCPTGIEAATCAASRNVAIVIATLSGLAAGVNVGGMVTYARVCCANEHHLPGIVHMLSRIPRGEPDSLKESLPEGTLHPPRLSPAAATTPTPSLHNHMFRVTGTQKPHRSFANR